MTLEQLYKDNKKRYIRKVYPYLPNQEVCEDIVQEAFAKALNKFHTYDPKRGGLSTWFNSVLFSVLWSYKRSLRKDPAMVNILDYLECDDLAYYEDTELFEIIETVKNRKHQKVLVSHFVLGYSYKETATHLNITQDNVRKIVQRFRGDYVE